MKDESLVEVARDFFSRVPKTEKASYYLGKMNGKAAQFNVSDGEPFYAEIKGEKVQVFKGSTRGPHWTFTASTPVYLAMFKGQIRMSVARGAGKLTILEAPYVDTREHYSYMGMLITWCQEEYTKALLASL